jgi:hypothetical protein
MSEMIDKQEAIDMILGQPPELHYPVWYAGQIRELPSVQLGTNLAEVGTDLISRQAAIDMCRKPRMKNADCSDFEMEIMMLPPVQPKRETATVSVGISKGGVTMWYECEACGEPVDQGDTFCSGCGRKLIHE